MIKKSQYLLYAKSLLCVLLALVMILGSAGTAIQAQAADSIPIDEEHFPSWFRLYVADQYDTNGDGYLSQSEIKAVTSMNLSASDWYAWHKDHNYVAYPGSLKGIEYFTELEYLNIEGVESVGEGRCYEVNVSGLTKLKELHMSYCAVTELDLTKLKDLEVLDYEAYSGEEYSHGITELDLSNNTKLKYINLDSHDLESIDVSNMPDLEYLNVGGNYLNKLDLSKNSKLKTVDASDMWFCCEFFWLPEGESMNLEEAVADEFGWQFASKVDTWEFVYGEDDFTLNGEVLTAKEDADKAVIRGKYVGSGTDSDPEYSVKITVAVGEKPTDITLSADSLRVAAGDSEELTATVTPSDARGATVRYSSSDASIATVRSQKVVGLSVAKGKGANPGSVKITATTGNGLTATCKVTVLFNDVMDESTYYYHPVYWAFNNDVTTGKADGLRFAPSDTCTRAQIVTFLWRLAGEPEPSAELLNNNPFSDIKSSAYYYKAVLWAYENGITTGRRGGKTFDPNGTCTRREIVTFLWRYAGKPEPSNTTSKFSDVQDSSAYYYKAVLWAVEKEITTGKRGGKRFDPTGLCTRGMAVTFLYRYANN